MFRAAAPVRARIKSVRHVEIPDADTDTVVRHLQMVARRMLAPESRRVSRVEESKSRGVRESAGVESEERFMKTISVVFCVVVAVALGACQETRARDRGARVGAGRRDRGAGGARSRRPHHRDDDRRRRSREAGRCRGAARHARHRSRAAARAGRAIAGGCAAAAPAGGRARRRRSPGRGSGGRCVGRRGRRAGRPRRRRNGSAAIRATSRRATPARRSSATMRRRDRDMARDRAELRGRARPARAKGSRGCAPDRGARKSRRRARASPPSTRRSRRSRSPRVMPLSWRRSAAS